MSSAEKLVQIVEASLLAAGAPLSLDGLQELFLEEERPDKSALREALNELAESYQGRGIELAEVGGGFRINVRQEYAPWVSRLWDERPARYSRALLETLALIAYRQPITRGEIEEIRGVSVSSNIVKTLMEREWVRVVGQRDVPGRPSLYATTREFLNYFGLKSLGDLPPLAEIRDLDSINRELALEEPGSDLAAEAQAAADALAQEAGLDSADDLEATDHTDGTEMIPAQAGLQEASEMDRDAAEDTASETVEPDEEVNQAGDEFPSAEQVDSDEPDHER